MASLPKDQQQQKFPARKGKQIPTSNIVKMNIATSQLFHGLANLNIFGKNAKIVLDLKHFLDLILTGIFIRSSQT